MLNINELSGFGAGGVNLSLSFITAGYLGNVATTTTPFSFNWPSSGNLALFVSARNKFVAWTVTSMTINSIAAGNYYSTIGSMYCPTVLYGTQENVPAGTVSVIVESSQVLGHSGYAAFKVKNKSPTPDSIVKDNLTTWTVQTITSSITAKKALIALSACGLTSASSSWVASVGVTITTVVDGGNNFYFRLFQVDTPISQSVTSSQIESSANYVRTLVVGWD